MRSFHQLKCKMRSFHQLKLGLQHVQELWLLWHMRFPTFKTRPCELASSTDECQVHCAIRDMYWEIFKRVYMGMKSLQFSRLQVLLSYFSSTVTFVTSLAGVISDSTWSLRSAWSLISPPDVRGHNVNFASTPTWKVWPSPSRVYLAAIAGFSDTWIEPSLKLCCDAAVNLTNVAWRCFGTSTLRSSSSFCLNLFLFCMISTAELRCTRFFVNSSAAWSIFFIRDSSSCLAELIRSILFLRAISKASKSCFSCCVVFVITYLVAFTLWWSRQSTWCFSYPLALFFQGFQTHGLCGLRWRKSDKYTLYTRSSNIVLFLTYVASKCPVVSSLWLRNLPLEEGHLTDFCGKGC